MNPVYKSSIAILTLTLISLSSLAQRLPSTSSVEPDQQVVLQVIRHMDSCSSEPGVYSLMEDGYYKVADFNKEGNIGQNKLSAYNSGLLDNVLELHRDNGYEVSSTSNVITDACGLVETYYLDLVPENPEKSRRFMAMGQR